MDNKHDLLRVEMLPKGFLRDYISLVHPLSEAPVQFHIANALVLVATSCARNVYLPFGAVEIYPNVYVIIISPSGIGRKTTALRPAYNILNQIAPKTILGTQVSLEGFYESFRESSNKIGYYSEFRTLMDNAKRKYALGLIPAFTDIWDCPSHIKLDLKSVKPDEQYIRNPTLSILGATTIEWLEVQELDITGGFFGRFLPIYVSGKREKLLSMPPKIDKGKLFDLAQRLKKISEVKGEFDLTNEARERIALVYEELWEEHDRLPNKNLYWSFWSRIQPHILKIAMILQMSKEQSSLTIDLETINLAVNLMSIIKGYYRDLLEKISFNENMRLENKILEILKEAGDGGIQRSALLRSMHIEAKYFSVLINTLQEKELIHERIESTATKSTKFYSLKAPEEKQDDFSDLQELEESRKKAAKHFFGEDWEGKDRDDK